MIQAEEKFTQNSEAPPITLKEADYLRLLTHGVTVFELLRIGVEFHLFEYLEESEGMSLEEISLVLEMAYQPVRILLLGLCSLQLLDFQEGKYVNREIARRRLLPSSARFLGPWIDMQHKIINKSMADFEEALHKNTNVGVRHIEGPGTTLYERLTIHPDLQQVFYNNMGDVSHHTFEQFRSFYNLSAVRHLVDIGGGDGTNSIELANLYPDLTVTIFDQKTVTELASKKIKAEGLEGRIRFHAGNLFTDSLPENADAILYFHIFEIWSLERNIHLLEKCHNALTEGGKCFVYNFASNNEGTGSLSAGLTSPYFHTLASGEGMVYSVDDMEKALLAAGFRHTERHENLGFSHALVVGHK